MSRSRTLATLVVLAAALALSGCGGEASPPAANRIEVQDAWVRATTGSADSTMTGAFMQITNSGGSPVRLTGATSPTAKVAQIHTMVMQGGQMVMQEMKGGLEVKPGSHAHLRPGGDHVMLMGLTRPLTAGQEVELVLTFSNGSSQTLTVPVKEFTEEIGHYHPSISPSPTMMSTP